MKNYNKILEAINNGIQLALDDFDDNDTPIQNIKSRQESVSFEKLIAQNIQLTNSNISSNSFRLDYPLAKYEDLGNMYHVIADGVIIDPKQYTVTNGNLSFKDKSILKANTNLEIRFIYNEKNEDVSSKKFDEYVIKQKVQQFPFENNKYEYSLDMPDGASEYFTDHNQVIVS